ncbi:hypothetical protein [Streptomyces sp. NPDC059071]|uniref:hypothetical protein n=1 Tax=unclassified Streptomyces TaxID=2593676 RepID=UPI003656D067
MVFTPAVREEFLALVAGGSYLGAAAASLGLSLNVPSQHAASDPAFAAALKEAKAVGRQARRDDAPHDEARYNQQACRCPRCTKAASSARMARKARAKELQPPALTAVPGPESPTSFLLRSRSSLPSSTAA